MNLRFNIRFRQQPPVPIFNACPYVNNYSAAHCFLLNDLIIRTICFFENRYIRFIVDYSDRSEYRFYYIQRR